MGKVNENIYQYLPVSGSDADDLYFDWHTTCSFW